MCRMLPVNNFESIEDIFQLNKDFTKNYNEEKDERYFLEFDVQYPENLQNLHSDLPFLPERMNIEKIEKLVNPLSGNDAIWRH